MFRSLSAAALAAALLLPGCAGGSPPDPTLAADHPGNPDAATAPLPLRSDTLAIPPAGSMPAAATPGEVAHAHAGPGEDDPMAQSPGGGGHDGMAGMDHGNGGVPGMRHDHGAVEGGDAAAAPAPAEAPSAGSPAPAAWTCPMHPDVHAAGPGPCPICGMKLVEKEGVQ